jgi:RHS repeat-associated protein
VASDNSQRYTAREQDLADLYHYRARYYSPRFERFVSEDPIDFAAGANLYQYVIGSPVRDSKSNASKHRRE